MSNHRPDRVAVEIQRELAQILRDEIADPRLKDVNITEVQVTGDLGQATIYYSLLSNLASDNKKAATALSKSKGLIRKYLATQMTLYKVPELVFKKDESLAYASKIDELLRNLNQD